MKVKRGKENSKRFTKGEKEGEETFLEKIRKKGLSNIVALVLIVFVSVLMVSIMWFGISSFLMIDISRFDARLSVETSQDYTFYDSVDKSVTLQLLASGEDRINYVQIIIKLSDGKELISVHNAPAPNNVKRYYFDLTSYFESGLYPVSVSAAPIFVVDGKNILGQRIADVKLSKREAKVFDPNFYFEIDKLDPTDDYSDDDSLGKYSTSGTNNVINVADCMELSEPGKKYELGTNIANDSINGDCCITITSPDITLDCKDYSITSTQSKSGVCSGEENTVVHNCNIDMGATCVGSVCGVGILLNGANNSYIYNNLLNSQYDGLAFYNVHNSIVNDNNAGFNSKYGIRLYENSSNNQLNNNNVSNNNVIGLKLNSSSHNTIINLVANENEVDGIFITSNSSYNVLKNIIANNNCLPSSNHGGVYVNRNSSYNYFDNVTSTANRCHLGGGFGLNFESEGDGNNITNSNLSNNVNGLQISVNHTTIMNSNINDNEFSGILITHHFSIVTSYDFFHEKVDNNILNNNIRGIYVEGSSGFINITNNQILKSAAGIIILPSGYLFNISFNTIEQSTSIDLNIDVDDSYIGYNWFETSDISGTGNTIEGNEP